VQRPRQGAFSQQLCASAWARVVRPCLGRGGRSVRSAVTRRDGLARGGRRSCSSRGGGSARPRDSNRRWGGRFHGGRNLKKKKVGPPKIPFSR
jgi:hypothetical protein